jgi:L-alanine-DL-glutamate epimerase-like enolase superfamily enzyme
MGAFARHVDLQILSAFESFNEVLQYIQNLAPGNTAIKAAFDMALYDLSGKISERRILDVYGNSDSRSIPTSFTIGIDSLDNMMREAAAAKEFHALKIKLNGKSDLEVVTALSSLSNQRIYVDANQAWDDIVYALEVASEFESLRVDFIEQPFRLGKWDDVGRLKEHTSIPIIADEDFQTMKDLEKISAVYNGINIKLMKCGGLSQAMLILQKARERGLKILLGCMSESSVAISAAAQIARLADWCDLDGNLMIKNDPCRGVLCQQGQLIVGNAPGIGIWDDEKLRQLLSIP